MAHPTNAAPPSAQELLDLLTALAHPQRFRIIAALSEGRNYVSQLARDLRMSRPLLHLHLARLEAAGLVTSEMALSVDGKAMRYVELTPFHLVLTPALVAQVVAEDKTLETPAPAEVHPKETH